MKQVNVFINVCAIGISAYIVLQLIPDLLSSDKIESVLMGTGLTALCISIIMVQIFAVYDSFKGKK